MIDVETLYSDYFDKMSFGQVAILSPDNFEKHIKSAKIFLESILADDDEGLVAWYQEKDEREDGKAFITITTDPNPVKAIPDPDSGDQNIWLYTISMVEHNGISFTVNEMTLQPFNGNVPMKVIAEYAERLASAWGENIIPANGMQYWRTGMPVQAISHMGILIKGIDANGSAMEFRSIVEFSHELAE